MGKRKENYRKSKSQKTWFNKSRKKRIPLVPIDNSSTIDNTITNEINDCNESCLPRNETPPARGYNTSTREVNDSNESCPPRNGNGILSSERMNIEHNDELPPLLTENIPASSDNFTVGRRVINVQHFLNQLAEMNDHEAVFGCSISHFEIVSEKRIGFHSKFKFRCKMCRKCFIVTSDEDTEDNNMTINDQAVSGVISIGSGYSQLQTLSSLLDVPGINPKLYMETQNKVFDWWETAAKQSMAEAAKEEAEYAIAEGNVDKNGIPMIVVIVDGCWCKRSYRTNYSALSGAAAIIGFKTKKVLYYGVKNKYCMICAQAANKNIDTPEHTCYKNYSGSSTSMESAIIVEGFKKSLETHGLIYNKFIADGDSSTYKAILDANPYPNITVEKIECKNHLMRNFCNGLVKVSQDTHHPCALRKVVKDRYLRLRIGVSKAITHWKNKDLSFDTKVANLSKDIQNGPRHVFGDHSKCADYFCTPESRRPEPINLIPSFVTSGLMQSLEHLSKRLSYHSRSLIYNVTSNAVESFNSQIAKYVGGKRVNFALRRSYASRCAAAVVSFNTGLLHSYTYESIFGKACKTMISRVEKFRHGKVMKDKYKKKKVQVTAAKDSHYGENCQKPDLSTQLYEDAKKGFLEELQMTSTEKHLLERSTVLQRSSAEWMNKRRKLLTASNFGEICKRGKTTRCAPVVKKIIYGSNISALPAVRYGIENEERALQQLSVQENVSIDSCGLFVDDEYPYLGASPDGVYGDGIVEIKCPSSLAGMSLEDAKKKHAFWKFDKKTNEYYINKNHNWYFQIQGQLRVSKRSICMFALWFGETLPMQVYRIHKDDQFWKEKMEEKLKNFYMDCLLPELVHPRVPRSLDIREPPYILEAIKNRAK